MHARVTHQESLLAFSMRGIRLYRMLLLIWQLMFDLGKSELNR